MDDEKHIHAVGGLGRVQRGERAFSVGELAISTAALTAVGVRGLVVDGRVILHAVQTAHGYRAAWVEQARGYALKVVRGYNVRGHFVAADSEQRACAKAQAHEPQAVA